MDVSCVVNEIQEVICHLLTTDCENNLTAIKTLENASYKLWVESNTAFLEESFISTCTEDDNWMWDEECFFEMKPVDDTLSTERSVCTSDINSSIDTSVSICDEFDCCFGYLGDGEFSLSCTDSVDIENDRYLDETMPVFEVRNVQTKSETKETEPTDSFYGAQIEFTSEEVKNENDEGWVIVEHTDGKIVKAPSFPYITESLRKEVVPTEIVPETCIAQECNDNDRVEEDEEDWTILSMKITEMKCVRVKHQSGIDFNVSRDSGIITPEKNCSWTTTGRMSIGDTSSPMYVPYG